MATQALVSEQELVSLLDSHHLRYLTEFEMRLLAASEFGYSAEEMAIGFGRSLATIHRRLADLKHRVFDFLELDESTTRLNHGRGGTLAVVRLRRRK